MHIYYIHHVLWHWKHPNKAFILYFYFTYSIVHKLWLLCPHCNNCLEHVHHLLSLEPVNTDDQSTECPRTSNTITGTNKVHIAIASSMIHSNSSIILIPAVNNDRSIASSTLDTFHNLDHIHHRNRTTGTSLLWPCHIL